MAWLKGVRGFRMIDTQAGDRKTNVLRTSTIPAASWGDRHSNRRWSTICLRNKLQYGWPAIGGHPVYRIMAWSTVEAVQ